MIQVQQLENKNQFIIEEDNKYYYQSYNSIIACVEGDKITLDEKYWDYSKTTLKHLYIFIDKYCPYKIYRLMFTIKGNKRASIQKAIENGEIKIADLN